MRAIRRTKPRTAAGGGGRPRLWRTKHRPSPEETPPPNSTQLKETPPRGPTRLDAPRPQQMAVSLLLQKGGRVFFYGRGPSKIERHPPNPGRTRHPPHSTTAPTTRPDKREDGTNRRRPPSQKKRHQSDSLPPFFFITPDHDHTPQETPPTPERVSVRAGAPPRERALPPACPAAGRPAK